MLYPVWQPEHDCSPLPSPVVSLQGPPGSVPQCSVPECSDSALTSSMMSISPVDGQFEQFMVPDVPAPLARNPAPSIQNAGQYPSPVPGFGCLTDALTSISPPAGAVKLSATVSIRPEVHELPDLTGVMFRWPLPSSATLAVELVLDSTSPVPQFAVQPVPLYWVPVS